MSILFVMDTRLGIELPVFEQDWEQYSVQERSDTLAKWEEIRGRIPERIYEIERMIIAKQLQLNVEDDFPLSCKLNYEISELASCITDLHLWYRANQELSSKSHQ
jgi:hypothetical protein